MVAKKGRFIPIQMSQRLAPPLTLCRASGIGIVVQLITLGESVVHPTGRQWGDQTIKQRLELARRLTREPRRKGYNQSHIPAFLKAFSSPQTSGYIYNKSRRLIREALQDGYAITLAGNVGNVKGPSKLKRDVNPVAHEMTFWDWQGGKRSGSVTFIDSMTPQGSASYIRRVSVSDMFQFGSAYYSNGVYIAERWKIGDYTQARMQERANAKLVLSLQKRNLEFRKLARDLDIENDALVDKYNQLEQLCNDGGVPAAEEQQALLLIEQAADLLRT